MARTLAITNGTTSVNLINASSPGIMLDDKGAGPTTVRPEISVNNPAGQHGGALQSYRFPPQIETYRLNLKGTSQDETAGVLQDLLALLRQAREYNDPKSKNWQKTPVYLQAQATNETNPRYSLILALSTWQMPDLFSQPFENSYEIKQMPITIMREPFWCSQPPETLPTPLTIGSDYYNSLDMLDGSGGTTANLSRSRDAAINGDYGGEIVVDGVGSEAYWKLSEPLSETLFVYEFQLDLSALTMANGDSFTHAQGQDAAAWRFNINITKTGDDFVLTGVLRTDGGGSSSDTYTLTKDQNKIKAIWAAASAPAANDGYLKIEVDDVEQISVTGVDNDTLAIGDILFGTIANLDAGTTGSIYIDDVRWGDADDDSWHQECTFEGGTFVPVGNLRQTTKLTHIYNYDDNLAAFSNNFVNAHEWTLFEVSGSTPALDDCVYLGSQTGPWFNCAFKWGDSGDYDATLVVEYWNGAWVTANRLQSPTVSMNSDGYDGYITNIDFANEAGDWATTAINGITAYWIRLRISAFVSWTDSPTQTGGPVYNANENYVEIHNAQIDGDEAAKTIVEYALSNAPYVTVSWIAMGFRSRGLDSFISMINAGAQLPTGWTLTYGADTSQTADDKSPGAYNATCTFGGTTTLAERVQITVNDGDEADFEGTYRVYLRCQQVGGSAGDVSVQFKLNHGPITEGETIALTQADNGPEIIDMGEFTVLPPMIRSGESINAFDLNFEVFAQSDNGTTPNLEIYDIILIPIDEACFITEWQYLDYQSMHDRSSVRCDSGISRQAATYGRIIQTSGLFLPSSFWSAKGVQISLPPNRTGRLYFLVGCYNNVNDFNEGFFSPLGLVKIYTVEQWLHLRGAE